MKEVQIKIKLYSYNELSEEAKEKAFNEQFNFLCYIAKEYETEKDIYNSVEESIRINEYLYFEDGEMAHIVTHVGDHEKAPLTEFIFKGERITL